MVDISASVRDRLIRIQREYKLMTEELSKPVQFLQSEDENDLNEQIRDVFVMAENVIQSVSDEMLQKTVYLKPVGPQIKEYRAYVERLNEDLNNKQKIFDSSVNASKKIFSDKLEILASEYKNRLTSLSESNKDAEGAMKKEIVETKKSLDQKLHQDVSAHILEKQVAETRLNKLRNEYELTSTALNTTLDASKIRLQLLEKQKAMLDDTNIHAVTALEDKFRQQLETLQIQHDDQMASLAAENAILSKQHEDNTRNYSAEIDRLTLELNNIETSKKRMIEDAIRHKALKNERKLKKLKEGHEKKLTNMLSQIDSAEFKFNSKHNLLSTQVSQAMKEISESQSRFKNSVKSITGRSEVISDEEQKEMRVLSKRHAKSSGHIEREYQLDIEKEKYNAFELAHDNKQKIVQSEKSRESLSKRIGDEMVVSKRAKHRREEELKHEPMDSTTSLHSPTIRNDSRGSKRRTNTRLTKARIVCEINPSKPPNSSNIDLYLNEQLSRFKSSSNRESELIAKSMKMHLDSFSIEIERQRVLKDISLSNLNDMENSKIKIMQAIHDTEHMVDIFQGKGQNHNGVIQRERELEQLIASQQAQIRQLKDQIHVARSDGAKNLSIKTIQHQNKETIKRAKERLNDLDTRRRSTLETLRKTYDNILYKERQQLEIELQETEQRAKIIRNDMDSTLKTYRNESEIDHNRWVAIKKEVANISNKALQVINTREDQCRPLTTVKAPRRVAVANVN